LKARQKKSRHSEIGVIYERSRLLLAVQQFNRKDFFECHETLEDIWFDVRDKSRDFYRGLLHLAVGFYHLNNKKNPAGALIQLNKALNRFENFGENFKGVDLKVLRVQTLKIITRLKYEDLPQRFPKIIIE
jgi:predicted metal-dependent hydrolase